MNVESGVVVQELRDADSGATTAGVGRYCNGQFVALYFDPSDSALYLSCGPRRVRIGPSTEAVLQRGPLDLRLRLSILCEGREKLRIQKLMSPRSMVAHLLDLPRDGLDHESDDFLPLLARIVNDPERQVSLRRYKDAVAGPWDRVGE